MAFEIERKFLVCGDYKSAADNFVHITQGYLNADKMRTVRVRIKGDRGFITVKGPTSGITRFEWEKEIPVEDAQGMISLCTGVIDKTRYFVPVDGHIFEVDEFHGDNDGLVVAEIELSSEDEQFTRPQWLGREVSDQPRYYNSQLMANPFKSWKD